MVLGSFAETLGQIPRDLDLRELMDMSIQEISAKDYHAMNVVTAYVLSRLAASQSMGIIGAGFKSPRHAVAMLAKRFPPVPDADVPLGSLPYITRQTVAYALSLVVSAVSYSRTCILTKGKAPLLYEKIYDELAKMTEDVFNEELLLLIRSYLFNTTAAEVQPTAAASATPGRAGWRRRRCRGNPTRRCRSASRKTLSRKTPQFRALRPFFHPPILREIQIA